jgi:hypothetical protein
MTFFLQNFSLQIICNLLCFWLNKNEEKTCNEILRHIVMFESIVTGRVGRPKLVCGPDLFKMDLEDTFLAKGMLSYLFYRILSS